MMTKNGGLMRLSAMSGTAQHMSANGLLENAAYHMAFAFVFYAFHPSQSITLE